MATTAPNNVAKKTVKNRVKTVSPQSPSRSTFLGMPGSWRWPGFGAIMWNMWDTSTNARLFPPKVWGYGWSLNFAYPLNKKNALWKRMLAFLVGLTILIVLVWLLVCVAVIIYYLIEAKFFPAENVIYLNLE